MSISHWLSWTRYSSHSFQLELDVAVEDVIVRLAECKRHIDANYRFIFVGRTEGIPRYYATVRALIAEFDMLPERFVFTGAVPDWELAAYIGRRASISP